MDKKKLLNYFETMLNDYKNSRYDWRYENGVYLLATQFLYEETSEDKYYDYVLDFLNKNIDEDGNIIGFDKNEFNIDNINCGKLLFKAYEFTNGKKYLKAINFLIEQLKNHPRTQSGNFWHKDIYPNQIWLDGLYMGQPFYMEYETKFNRFTNYKDIYSQFLNVRKYLYDENKHLYYHAYDESKQIFWCDKTTGLSQNFWGRAIGWYLMAIVDTLEQMNDQMFYEYRALMDLLKEAVNGVLEYQHESGMFYQVFDKTGENGNYLESSATSMISYAILKAVRLELLPVRYRQFGVNAFNGICNTTLKEVDGVLQLENCNLVSGLGGKTMRDGSFAYYLSEPIVYDEKKAVGALLMAFTEMLKLEK